ncbi:MAG: transketolase [Acidimicrobiia bacterium]
MTAPDQLAADAIRILSIDAVERANSGHPGAPMGMADMAVALWGSHLRIDPTHPTWPDRDRFVLSNGHASMLLYSLLHLSGFPLGMDDIRGFRKLGSPTPGHPEVDAERGLETTTGPLGQGFATGVGMAIAEAHLRATFGHDLVDHRVYGFVSDGDLMEGVASEAASLAGHLGLGRIVYLYDDNAISLVGPTDWTYSEDVPARFGAYGWHTLTVDGHDRTAIAEAIGAGIEETARPTLISCKTHIGFGSPNKQDSAAAHGSPLGAEEIELVREGRNWPHPPFEVPDAVYGFFADAMARGTEARTAWEDRRDRRFAADPEGAALWRAHFDPKPVTIETPEAAAGTSVATRKAAGAALNAVAADRPDLLGGAADLASSTSTIISGSPDFSRDEHRGRNIRFGVREHAMGSIVNGITVHGGLRAFGATFMTFSDYMRGAVRLGALMDAPSIWVWTHDSIFLGEDGPTHQPVEHVAALRAIPNLWVVRPSDPAEAAGAWQLALNRTSGPTALVLTRQGLPVPDVMADPSVVGRGAHVVHEGTDAVLVATGSEVWVAREAAALLRDRGVAMRVVSMPCVEAFAAESAEYRSEILGEGLPIASLEAAVTFGWAAITGGDGLNIGIDRFGASAPWQDLATEFGFTPEAVAGRIAGWLEAR